MGDYERKPTKAPTAGPSEDDRFGSGKVGSNLGARIIKVDIVDGRTRITIAQGTTHGARVGMEGYIKSAEGALATFQIHEAKEAVSYAFADVTPNQLRNTPTVVINPTSKNAPRIPQIKEGESSRVIAVNIVEGKTRITIARGSLHGVKAGMRGTLQGNLGNEGATFTIEYTSDRVSYAYVKGTLDQVQSHSFVVLQPNASPSRPVQRRASGAATTGDVQSTAEAGVASASSRLPFFDTIQRSFGKHDISGVQAQVGGAATAASQALGAQAYATGNRVAFASAPDLHTAAHEAAHTVQQSRGAVGFQGLGAADDEHERHADAVADAVVAGQSAEPLLDQLAGGGSAGAVQRKEKRKLEAEVADAVRSSPFADKSRPVINWRSGIQKQAMPDPYRTLDCRFGEQLQPTPGVVSREHARPPKQSSKREYGLIEDVSAWTAIKHVTAKTHTIHASVGTDVTAYREVQEQDPELRALDFRMPAKGRSLTQVTNQQQLPDRGGAKIGELFDESDALTLDDDAYTAIHRSANQPHLQTDIASGKANAEGVALEQAVVGVAADLEGIKVARSEMDGALHDVAAERLENRASDARAEIEGLKAEAAELKDQFDLAFSFIAGATHMLEGGIGDSIEKLGEIVGYLMAHVNDRNIAPVEERLRKTERALRTERAKALAAKLDARKAALHQAVLRLEQSKLALQRASSHRAMSYRALGRAAASEFDGTDESKRKLASMMAARPLVELVIARAHGISSKCEHVPYTEDAGHGLWLAKTHGEQRVGQFLRAVAEIDGTKDIFLRVAKKWERRLDSLRGLERIVTGRVPRGE